MTPRDAGTFPLFRLGGIPVVADVTWLIQVALLTVVARNTLVVRGLVVNDPSLAQSWLVSLGLALGIVACIVAHEAAHAAVARAYGLPVRRIVLFMLGGVSQIDREAPGPRAETAIAIAGPLASLAIGTSLAAAGHLQNPSLAKAPGAWEWFAQINVALAFFNLLPAFPMDGGRVLRSALWGGLGDRTRATRWAARAGQGFAGLLGALGLVVAGGTGDTSGAWMILLAVFLFGAAGNAGRMESGARPNEPRERTP